jgi:hypothetical protein
MRLFLLPLALYHLPHTLMCEVLHVHLHQKLVVRATPEGEWFTSVWVCCNCDRDVRPAG